MKKIVLSLLVLSLFLSLCGAGGVFADVGSQEAARSSVADKKTTKDSFLIGSWVSYYDYSISSYEEQTAFMADAGLNFNIFPHIWNTGEVDSTGTQFWQYVDETYRKNNMVYLIDDFTTYGDYPLSKAAEIVSWTEGLENCVGYHVYDEPHPSVYEDIIVPYYHELQRLDPTRFPLVNLLPAFPGMEYFEYVDGWIDAVGAENITYLSHDYYPMNENSTDLGLYGAMEVMRKAAYENGKLRTHAFPQASKWTNKRMPNADEMRWNAYAYVAYGFKALSWFNLVTPGGSGEGFSMSPIHRDGVIYDEELFESFKQLNWELRGIGDALMGLDAVHAYHTRADTSGIEVLPTDWAIQPVGNENLVISEMEAKDGSETHIMIFNKSWDSSVSPSFTVDEYSGITGLEWLNPATGEYESVSLGNRVFSTQLRPGEGKLFRLLGDFNTGAAEDAPQFSLPSGRYSEAIQVGISAPEEIQNGQIRYTLDGTYPTESSPLYEGEILIGEEPGAKKYYLRAAVFYNGRRGEVVTREYFIINHGDYTDKLYRQPADAFSADGVWNKATSGRIAYAGGGDADSVFFYVYRGASYGDFAAEAQMHLGGLGSGMGGFYISGGQEPAAHTVFIGVSAAGEVEVLADGKQLSRGSAPASFDYRSFTMKVIKVADNFVVYLDGQETLSTFVTAFEFASCNIGVAATGKADFAADSLRSLPLDSNKTELEQPILSVESIPVLLVDLYTPKADVIALLPDAVTVQAGGGITAQMKVQWHSDFYDRTVSGDHTFYGTLIAEPDSALINPNNVEATVIVRVRYDLILWELEEITAEVESLDPSQFTADSWANVQERYDTAIELMQERDRPQSNVFPVWRDLRDAIDSLVNPSLKWFPLTDLLNKCRGLCESDYTGASYAAFKQIVESVESMPVTGPLMQADIDARIAQLEAARDLLVPLGDVRELNELISLASSADASQYTAESWKNLQDTLAAAKTAAASPEATQNEVDCYVQELRNALRSLVPSALPEASQSGCSGSALGGAALAAGAVVLAAGMCICILRKTGNKR